MILLYSISLFILASLFSLSAWADQISCPTPLTCGLVNGEQRISCTPNYSNMTLKIIYSEFPSGNNLNFVFNRAVVLKNGGSVSCIYSLSTNPNLQIVQLTTMDTDYIPTGNGWKPYDPNSVMCQGDAVICTFSTK